MLRSAPPKLCPRVSASCHPAACQVSTVAAALPVAFIPQLITALAEHLQQSPHLEFVLRVREYPVSRPVLGARHARRGVPVQVLGGGHARSVGIVWGGRHVCRCPGLCRVQSMRAGMRPCAGLCGVPTCAGLCGMRGICLSHACAVLRPSKERTCSSSMCACLLCFQ